jgi:hypothetical protein
MPADDHLSDAQMHEYRGLHQPHIDPDEPRIHNMEKLFPEDVYTHPHYYGHSGAQWGNPYEHEAYAQLRKAQGNPEAKVRLWRAVPKDAPDVINEGDWVTTSGAYARQHGQSNLSPGYKVLRITAPAAHVVTGGNDVIEWGYGGPSRPAMRTYQHRPTKRQRELGGWGD